MEVLVRGIALLLLGLFMAYVPDRFPRSAGLVRLVGSVLIIGAVVYYARRAPGVTALFAGIVVVGTWGLRCLAVVVKPRLEQGTAEAISVWASEMELLDTLGWEYLGTWVMDAGQTQPAFMAYERPQDGSRVGMVGTAPQGGVVTVETLFDDGRGMMVTQRKRSATLRPHWMFRQELPGSLLDLIRAHDEALYLLHSQGVTAGGRVHGDPLEFEMYTSEKIRRDALRNWWRWAFPFACASPQAPRVPSRNRRDSIGA